ncbi:DUF5947 family protein [Streptomyces sp. NPDC093085]|uniref:DUF5947 family protein n=1 Tax=Streptomyces sp. NPDC093085 TaxID=3155068 RepID=UPI003439224C
MSAPAGAPRSPAAALLRVTRDRPEPVPGERCDLCAAPSGAEHQHVVDLESRRLMCCCRACYLLFTDDGARLRYRAVPDRYLRFDRLPLDARAWDALGIPVGLAFLFRNSAQDRTVAFYPGPAGATESELPLDAWASLVADAPELAVVRPDVEALLVRRTEGPGRADGGDAKGNGDGDRYGDGDGPEISCHVVPIDACYELAGRLRTLWRGFDGGREARVAMDSFFERVRARSRPARPDERTTLEAAEAAGPAAAEGSV